SRTRTRRHKAPCHRQSSRCSWSFSLLVLLFSILYRVPLLPLNYNTSEGVCQVLTAWLRPLVLLGHQLGRLIPEQKPGLVGGDFLSPHGRLAERRNVNPPVARLGVRL